MAMFAGISLTPWSTATSIVILTISAAIAGPARAGETAAPSGPVEGLLPAQEAAVILALDRCLDRGLPAAEAVPACNQANMRSVELEIGQRAALLHRLGQITLGQGRHQAAVGLLEQSHLLEPTVAPYLLTLGDALAAGGEVERAAAVYRAGQQLAPTSAVFGARLEALPTSIAVGAYVKPTR
jgi:tetratricopeptide (TPR) repeat protein